jgi:transglutaminase-like putative cysteine protease
VHPGKSHLRNRSLFCLASALLLAGFAASSTCAADAPSWMHALAGVALPEHDEKTDAVLLYSEQIVTVQSNGKIRRVAREAYKILRPDGVRFAIVHAFPGAELKVMSMRGWCIPSSGKDYEVKDKDAVEGSLAIQNGELVNDVRLRTLKIPDAEPGSVVGSEIEEEENLYVLQDFWRFQDEIPVREARYSLSLPAGWEYKTAWVNAQESKPTPAGANQWQWVVSNVKDIRYEEEMPPWHGVAGVMLVSLIPPGGTKRGFVTWTDVAKWTATLSEGRREPSPAIKQKVAELTAAKPDTLAKMQAIADYMQRDIRYVAIELGIGGWQPHPARDVYNGRYGDCKDKATLMSTMLKEVGVDSYYVVVNARRGAVDPNAPAHYWFNHIILAVRLPDNVKDASLLATYRHPSLGRLLIFDPTDEMTPLGYLRGQLQGNYALLVTPDGGDLLKLPVLSPQSTGVHRAAKLTLSPAGVLSGEVIDIRYGDSAMRQRYAHQDMQKKEDQIKPIESLLAQSFGAYQITHASIGNLDVRDQPFQYKYSFVVPSYAKSAGDLLLVRPRVLGEKSSDILEKKEPRRYPVELEGPRKDVDRLEIALPAGYEVDELPPATDVDYPFGSYHSKTELKENALIYTRTFEIKQVTIALDQMDDLKKFYRLIATDERGTAVLKPSMHP